MQVVPGIRRWVLGLAILAIPAVFITPVIGIVLLGVAVATRWFHRDPDRTIPPAGIVAPADGRVSELREEAGRVTVRIFMGPQDVHVNRAPLVGEVRSVQHTPGAHWPAFTDRAARNERVEIETDVWELTLIAGTVGRRIRSYVDPGDRLERGDRVAHISFGSRAEFTFPDGFRMEDLRVGVGDRLRAGETILADAQE